MKALPVVFVIVFCVLACLYPQPAAAIGACDLVVGSIGTPYEPIVLLLCIGNLDFVIDPWEVAAVTRGES